MTTGRDIENIDEKCHHCGKQSDNFICKKCWEKWVEETCDNFDSIIEKIL